VRYFLSIDWRAGPTAHALMRHMAFESANFVLRNSREQVDTVLINAPLGREHLSPGFASAGP
jgi:hypothetical protein